MNIFNKPLSQRLPGVDGNPFDIILKKLFLIQNIPDIIFLAMIFLISYIFNFNYFNKGLYLALFIIGDWILVSLLPIFRLSYGPPKPVTFLLLVFRCFFSVLPLFPFLVIQTIGTLLVVYGFFVEPQQIEVNYQRKKIFLNTLSKPFKILHISDLHIELKSKREEKLECLFQEISPDLILISGDILNLSYLKNTKSINYAIELLNKMVAPYGTFFVSGSPAVDRPEVLKKILPSIDLIRLDDSSKKINIDGNKLNIIGITCTHNPEVDYKKLKDIITNDDCKNNILLYHSPDIAPHAAKENISLQLSGHTHGGQVRLPFLGALFTGSLLGKRFDSGFYEVGEMTLYVSRGLGMEGLGAPRVRFNCRPELIVWELY